jgi:hypothetical protein
MSDPKKPGPKKSSPKKPSPKKPATESLLSVDQTTQLLRFYLSWPELVEQKKNEEANHFYTWLGTQLDELALKDITGGIKGVKQFLQENKGVIGAGQHFKNTDANYSNNSREEEHIPTGTQVFVVIYDCDKDPELESAPLKTMMMDVGKNGMRLESKDAIPAGTIVTMTVAQTGTPLRLFHLTGEVRWVSEAHETNHMGMAIFNIEDDEDWRDYFSSTFS